MTKIEREDDGKNGRFLVYVNNELAGEMTYTSQGESKFTIVHTEVNEKFSGQGLGKKLVMASVEFARENNLKINTLCSYAKMLFEKDNSLSDVIE